MRPSRSSAVCTASRAEALAGRRCNFATAGTRTARPASRLHAPRQPHARLPRSRRGGEHDPSSDRQCRCGGSEVVLGRCPTSLQMLFLRANGRAATRIHAKYIVTCHCAPQTVAAHGIPRWRHSPCSSCARDGSTHSFRTAMASRDAAGNACSRQPVAAGDMWWGLGPLRTSSTVHRPHERGGFAKCRIWAHPRLDHASRGAAPARALARSGRGPSVLLSAFSSSSNHSVV